jgi:hypothetical protein
VPERWYQARPAQEAQGSLFCHVDYDGVIRFPVADECDDTAIASRRVPHGAVVTADRERAHGEMIAGGCDAEPIRSAGGVREAPEDREELLDRDQVGAAASHLGAHSSVIGRNGDRPGLTKGLDQRDYLVVGLDCGG